MPTRGIRGATTVQQDKPDVILLATRELLQVILDANVSLRTEDIASVFFTLTGDLCSAYPAEAARQIGWEAVPLVCAQEIAVPGSLPGVIRVLIHWNTEIDQSRIRHVYLRGAALLRPEWAVALSEGQRVEVQP